jgi:hypothetical protein
MRPVFIKNLRLLLIYLDIHLKIENKTKPTPACLRQKAFFVVVIIRIEKDE